MLARMKGWVVSLCLWWVWLAWLRVGGCQLSVACCQLGVFNCIGELSRCGRVVGLASKRSTLQHNDAM